MDYDIINLIQLMVLIVVYTSIFSYALHSYKRFKDKAEENIIGSILTQWLEFIKRLAPQHYITFEKYGIWRYSGRFKIKMMF